MKPIDWLAVLWLALVLLGAGCQVEPPDTADCIEFDRRTLRAGAPVVCRMLWCDSASSRGHNASGLAALWCDED